MNNLDNETLDNIPLESPLNKYSYQLDKKLLGKNIFEYYAIVEKVESKYLTNLLLKDFEYRFNSQLNILAEVYGQQGCQPKDSKVLMANGSWKNIQDIKVGDEVLSPQLNKTHTFAKVLKTFSWFSEENYDIIQLNRQKKLLYKCSHNHLIPLRFLNKIRKTIDGKRKLIDTFYSVKNLTAKEYCQRADQQKGHVYTGFSTKATIAINSVKGKPAKVFGFLIDSPSNFYITDNFMVTHNCGKSLFAQDLAYRTGKIFGLDFVMDTNTVADFDILDSLLHNSPYRSTFVVDEQPTSMFGYGSSRVMHGLKDFEEISRYTQKNIFYIAPTEREHSSYYVFKEDQKPSVERFRNQACLDCPKQSKCSNLQDNMFETLCDLPFWKRHGYPVAFNFMLITARKTDNHLMPRGYIRLPILPPKLMKQYDKIKRRNLDLFEQKESAGWTQQRAELRNFQEQFRDRLIKPDGKVVSKDLIKVYLQDYFGGRAFTTSELDMFTAIIKAEILSPEFAESTQKELNQRID